MWPAVALLLARTVPMEGLVIAVSPGEPGSHEWILVVSHRAVPGIMPAMAMPVRVRDASLLQGVVPGTVVNFDLVIRGAQSQARHVRLKRADNSFDQDGRKFRIETPREKLVPGRPPPAIALTDQRGRPFQWSNYTGRVVVVQFLYTRCPMPEVCPRLAATFAALQRRFSNRMGQDVALVSVTLDPLHDTPAELSRYATLWRAGDHWRFLTGPEDRIRTTAASFGLTYWPEEGVITHTSTIGIVGRDGKLAALVEGLSFTAQQLGDLIAQQLE